MSDRYATSYYEQLHPAQAQAQAAMSHYTASGYRSSYASNSSNYSPYSYGSYVGTGPGAGAYMPSYYRYAPYASPHYSQPAHHQHPGMFTAAGQQLIPSSVLHYPPRQQPQQQQQQQQQQHPHANPHLAYQQQQLQASSNSSSGSSYEQPAPALYSASPYGQSRGFAAYQSASVHYTPPGRSSTPAPNRTVLPPNYLEPMRSYVAEQQQQHQQQQQQLQQQQQQQQLPLLTPKLEEPLPEQLKQEQESTTETPSPAQRLTTSPPLISATGTDSGISNCSTRARSDSSQSTPVYSGEYPVNMSVESASCVSYHCPADGRDYEEEQQQQQQQQQQHQSQTAETAEEQKAASSLDTPDDISATASTSPAQGMVSDIDKEAAAIATTEVVDEQPEVARRAEINLPKPDKETAATTTATTTAAVATTTPAAGELPPQDIVEQQQPETNQINENAAERGPEQQQQQQQPPPTAVAVAAAAESPPTSTATLPHNWSPSPRRQRTPPAPQNSPVGYGLAASAAPLGVPPALAPLLQQQLPPVSSKRSAKQRSSSSHNNNNNASSGSSNNRIIECDLIPSKKSKRKTSKRETEAESADTGESLVREQIRDIKPLPGFQQAFGSTEIGRFSERFLQTPESLVERLVEEYAVQSSPVTGSGGGYYENPSMHHPFWPYEEHHQYGQHMASYQSSSYPMSRSRMRGQSQSYPTYPDYAAYERYGHAAYNRLRYGEIRCNGY